MKALCTSPWIAAAFCLLGTMPLSAVEQQRENTEKLAAANNRFAWDLYTRLAEKPGNLFYSPYSISSALAMTYAGARGQTAAEMARTLHFGDDPAALAAASGTLMRELNPTGKERPFQLNVANALWLQQDYKILAAYKRLVEKNYAAGLEMVNFKTEAEAARKKINAWVEKKTNDKIRDLIQQGVLTSDTRLVLTNAIYFKSAWQTQFPKEATQVEPFTRGDGGKADVPLMHLTAYFPYFEAEGFQALHIPYVERQLSMTILLPQTADGLPALEKKLSADALARWDRQFKQKKVILTLPKFKTTSQFGLKPVLSSMGMPGAFSGGADFSGIDGTRDLFLQDVIHKAFVDVNEEGTEAAAATAVIVGVKSDLPAPEEPIVFRADHPFVFLIRHNPSGSVLFVGRVADPKQE